MEDEEATSFQAVEPSPLEQFRSQRTLSVSDLVSPAWYVYLILDYGTKLASYWEATAIFVSSSGEIISVEKSIAKENDVRTKQGRVRHQFKNSLWKVLTMITL